MVPVDESILNPLGSAGEIDHVTTAPPCDVGVRSPICESLAKDSEVGL